MNLTSLILVLATGTADKPVFLDLDREFSQAGLVAEVELIEVKQAGWMRQDGIAGSLRVRVTSDPGRIWRGFESLGKTLDLQPPTFGPGACTTALIAARKEGRTRWLFITDKEAKHLMIAGDARPTGSTPGWRLQSWCDYNAVFIATKVGKKVGQEPFECERDVTIAEFNGRYGVDRATMLLPLYRRLSGKDVPTRYEVGKLTAELVDADSNVRDAAQDNLIFLGGAARPDVESALEDAKNPEMQLRLRRILDAIDERKWIEDTERAIRRAGPESEARVYLDVMSLIGGDDVAAVAKRLRVLARKATPRIDVRGLSHQRVLSLWRTHVEPPAYAQAFTSKDARKEFAFSDPKVWSVKPDPKGGWLEHRAGQKYKTPQRSPHNIGLAADWTFGDFILEAEFLQTGREYGHRDQCVFFGFKDPTRFYYVHISSKADQNAHNVFLVNKKPRRSFAKETTKGIDWGKDTWHKVRIERTLADGQIKVFFDDMSTPIMRAESKTHGRGWIGFGSFDDEGRVRNIKVWSKSAKRERTKSFATNPPK